MFFVVKAMLLFSLLKILSISKSPGFCAGIYCAAVFIWRLFAGAAFFHNVLISAISFGLSFGYFWVLDRYDGDSLIWWPVMLIGMVMIIL
jgi:hypothetical protein